MPQLTPSKLVSCLPILSSQLLIRSWLGLQKSAARPGQSAFSRIASIAGDMWRQEGVRSFYKGITPRVLRVAPGLLPSL